jgi:CBS domain-containing protein
LVEGTGQIRVLLPVMVVVVISNYFAYLVHKDGVYDVLLKIKGYPFLEPSENKQSLDVIQVREIMSSPVVTLREKERAIKLVRLLASCPHNGFPIVGKKGRFKGLVRRKQIVALIECGIFQKLSSYDDISLDSSKESDLIRPKVGFGEFQSLMHWALHVKDDRYGEDLPEARPQQVEDLDDDEFGENSFLLHIERTLKDVEGKFANGQASGPSRSKKTNPRTSFLGPAAMKQVRSNERRITMGGDDTMPSINAENLQCDLSTPSENDENENERRESPITSPKHTIEGHKGSVASIGTTDSTASAVLLTALVQPAPTSFATVGQDPVEGNVVISWLNPANHDDVVNLEAVMNCGAYCVPEHFPVSKAYRMFTKLGLRWIVVVGGESGGEVVGILTRATLLNTHIYNQTGIDMSCFET